MYELYLRELPIRQIKLCEKLELSEVCNKGVLTVLIRIMALLDRS